MSSDDEPGTSNSLPSRSTVRSQPISLLDSMKFGQAIGQGSFGRVYIAVHGITGRQYAVKKIFLSTMAAEEYNLIQEEVYNMKSLSHIGLLKLEASLTWSNSCFMIMPLMRHRSCQQIIAQDYKRGLPESAIGLILKDVLNALQYIHGKNYIHLGIRGSHILISTSGAAVLSGFRHMVQIPTNKRKEMMVSKLQFMSKNLNWLAPEILRQDNLGFSLNSDIYSIGITAIELGNGVVPYSDMSASALLVKKLEETPPRLWDKYFLPSQETEARASTSTDDEDINTGGASSGPVDNTYKQKSFSKDFQSFVAMCVVNSPNARMSCAQAIKMKFISTYWNKHPSDILKRLPMLSPHLDFYTHSRPELGELVEPHNPEDSSQSDTPEEWDFD